MSENNIENEEINDIKVKISEVTDKLGRIENKIISLDKEYEQLNVRKKGTKSIKCNHCENTFDSSSELEKHLDSLLISKDFKCSLCANQFHTKWRLAKHMTNHESTKKKRNCHYYNAGKQCPYEKLGCKFIHEVSSKCKYGDQCAKHMCQLRHQIQ